MTHRPHEFSGDTSHTGLDGAIAAVLAEPVPRESLERSLKAALSLDSAPIVNSKMPRGRWIRLSVAALGTSAVMGLLAILWNSDAENQRAEESPSTVGLFESGPLTRPFVAESAPVFVSAGPEEPVMLGAMVTREELTSGTKPGLSRLHVWNWSESDLSRVIEVPLTGGSCQPALSPDGTVLLSSSGVAVNLESGESRQVDRFDTGDNERIWRIRYSPGGRYVLAWIQSDSQPNRLRLRVIDTTTREIVTEFPCGWHAAFLPDESSIIYSRPEEETPRRDIISRRDLTTMQVTVEYVPMYGPEERPLLIDADLVFDSVGIAISPDRRFVAVGYYYGQLFVWETQTGKKVSHQLFLRADGTRDTFFQAKLMRFSPNGELLAAASNGRLKIVETQTGNVLAEHYHEATPYFAHLRWGQNLEQVTLLSYSSIGGMDPESGFPGRVTADILPRLYVWNWKQGAPFLKEFPEADR